MSATEEKGGNVCCMKKRMGCLLYNRTWRFGTSGNLVLKVSLLQKGLLGLVLEEKWNCIYHRRKSGAVGRDMCCVYCRRGRKAISYPIKR